MGYMKSECYVASGILICLSTFVRWLRRGYVTARQQCRRSQLEITRKYLFSTPS